MEFPKYNPGELICDDYVIQHAVWMAGAFEGGGYISLHSYDGYEGTEYLDLELQTCVSMGFQDKNIDRLSRMHDFFDGEFRPIDNSYQWSLRGRRAGWVAEQVGDQLPSYQELMPYIRAWNETEDFGEAFAIGKKANSVSRNLSLPMEAYLDLVQNPLFMAGIIDRKGRFGIHNRKSRAPRVGITTNNKALLDAMQQVHGGNRQVWKREGDTFEINGKTRVVKNESATLSFVAEKARRVMRFVQPASLINREKIQLYLSSAA